MTLSRYISINVVPLSNRARITETKSVISSKGEVDDCDVGDFAPLSGIDTQADMISSG